MPLSLKIPRQKNPTLPLRSRAHGKKDQSPHGLLTAHMFVTSYHMSQLQNQFPSRDMFMPWHAPAKIKRGGHFCVLTGMWVFQPITLHRTSNSPKSCNKIRLAFHFVERKKSGLGWRHKLLCMHVYKDLIQCKSVCDVHPGLDPYPLLARSCNR